jgi:hypothetical protein
MEEIYSSQTFVVFDRTTLHYTPETRILFVYAVAKIVSLGFEIFTVEFSRPQSGIHFEREDMNDSL